MNIFGKKIVRYNSSCDRVFWQLYAEVIIFLHRTISQKSGSIYLIRVAVFPYIPFYPSPHFGTFQHNFWLERIQLSVLYFIRTLMTSTSVHESTQFYMCNFCILYNYQHIKFFY